MVICLERGADLHMAQLMPLPLTVSCFSKIQIGCTFMVPAHPGSPGQRAVKRVCVSYYFGQSLQTCCVFTASFTMLCRNNAVNIITCQLCVIYAVVSLFCSILFYSLCFFTNLCCSSETCSETLLHFALLCRHM